MDGEDTTEEGPEVEQVVRVVTHGDQRRHGVLGRVVNVRLPYWGVADLEDPRRARPRTVGGGVVARAPPSTTAGGWRGGQRQPRHSLPGYPTHRRAAGFEALPLWGGYKRIFWWCKTMLFKHW